MNMQRRTTLDGRLEDAQRTARRERRRLQVRVVFLSPLPGRTK
jgi:hypothetical protein